MGKHYLYLVCFYPSRIVKSFCSTDHNNQLIGYNYIQHFQVYVFPFLNQTEGATKSVLPALLFFALGDREVIGDVGKIGKNELSSASSERKLDLFHSRKRKLYRNNLGKENRATQVEQCVPRKGNAFNTPLKYPIFGMEPKTSLKIQKDLHNSKEGIHFKEDFLGAILFIYNLFFLTLFSMLFYRVSLCINHVVYSWDKGLNNSKMYQ